MRILPTLTSLLVVTHLTAQAQPPAIDPGALAAITSLQPDDTGGWTAWSGGYLASIAADGFVFTPVLGNAAPTTQTWSFRITEFGRGADLAAVGTECTATTAAKAVHFDRGGLTESYTVRSDGVKQDFVFDVLPSGIGDLRVRGEVVTTLPAGEVTADGMRFELPGIGGVAIGAVLGMDANGEQATGSMEFANGRIEFRLPAAFVDRAALPLRLDPLIGTIAYKAFGPDITTLDAACAEDGVTWAIVWERRISATNGDVMGTVWANGSFHVGSTTIDSSTVDATAPRIAALHGSNQWLVVHGHGTSVRMLGWDYDSDVVRGNAAILTTSGQYPVVGGDSRNTGTVAMVAWADPVADEVRLCPVTVPLSGPLAPGTTYTVSSSYANGRLDISRTGGAAGRWLVAYPRNVGSTLVRNNLFARTWTLATSSFGAVQTILAVGGDYQVSVDGDGARWLAAYQVTEAGSTARDIFARPLYMAGSSLRLGLESPIAEVSTIDESAPSVAWLGESALVAYTTQTAGTDLLCRALSVEPNTCATCEGRFDLNSPASDRIARVGSYSLDGTFPGQGLCIWQGRTTSTSTMPAICAHAFLAADGAVTDLGGGCGAGGTLTAACALSPTLGFSLILRGAAANATTFFCLGFDSAGGTCGPCALRLDPFDAVIGVTTTNSLGENNTSLQIVAGMVGRQFVSQWFTVGTNCAAAFDLSNGIRVTIQ